MDKPLVAVLILSIILVILKKLESVKFLMQQYKMITTL